MNKYIVSVSNDHESIEVKVIEKNIKEDFAQIEQREDFCHVDFKDNGDEDFTIYAYSKAQALYLAVDMLKEFAIFNYQEDAKEWAEEERQEQFKKKIFDTIKRG